MFEENLYIKNLTESLPEFIKNHENDYEAYFLTLTVKNTSYYLTREKYDRLEAHLWYSFKEPIPKKATDKLPRLFVIPEASKAIPLKIRGVSNPHLHCVLLIHKKYHEKTVLKHFISTGQKSSRNRLVETWTLSEKIIQKLNTIVPICSIDIRKKYESDTEESSETILSKYSTKGLLSLPRAFVNYKLSDIRNFSKIIKTTAPSRYLTNENICYDDVKFFVYTEENNKKHSNFPKQINTSVTEKNYVEQPVI